MFLHQRSTGDVQIFEYRSNECSFDIFTKQVEMHFCLLFFGFFLYIEATFLNLTQQAIPAANYPHLRDSPLLFFRYFSFIIG